MTFKVKKVLVVLSIFTCLAIEGKIRILCTAALIDEGFELRKNQYIECVNILAQYGYSDPYFVEAIKQASPTFLDLLSCHVFYSTVNDASLRNKGVNEGRTMLEALKFFNFDPDDMVIKLTGRYHLTSDNFLRVVENNPEYDGFVKREGGGILTGFYALRYKHLVKALEYLDYEKMEKDMLCIEIELENYLQKLEKKRKIKIMEINPLNIRAHVWGVPGYHPGVLNW